MKIGYNKKVINNKTCLDKTKKDAVLWVLERSTIGIFRLELASNKGKGLRLPQLTSGQFTTMIPKLSTSVAEAKRFAVFNKGTNCIEIKS